MRDNKIDKKITQETTRFDLIKKMFAKISDSEQSNLKSRLEANDDFKKFHEDDNPSKYILLFFMVKIIT